MNKSRVRLISMEIVSVKPNMSLPEKEFENLRKRALFKIKADLKSFGESDIEPLLLVEGDTFFVGAILGKSGFDRDGHFYISVNPDSFKIEDLFREALRSADIEKTGPACFICPLGEDGILVIFYDPDTSALAAEKMNIKEKDTPGPLVKVKSGELKAIIDLF